jgi:hypothetical protein
VIGAEAGQPGEATNGGVGPIGRQTVRAAGFFLARRVRGIGLVCTRPFGYLAFVLALAALSASAKLLGEEHELGFFAGRLNETIRRYPEVTRRGVQMAWLSWFLLLALALSPIDPIASRWDEVLLFAIALGVLWHRRFHASQAGR